MPKWKKESKEFVVKIHYVNDGRGNTIRVPKPILEKLQNPTGLKFVIVGSEIQIHATNNRRTD